MVSYITWSFKKLVECICDRLQNRFDSFLVIEGKRGLGKSTLGYKLMFAVKKEMRRRGSDGYKFYPERDLLYERPDVISFFKKWKHSGMADEMINVTFNRDFYAQGQKDLIKLINMNRDHSNFFIACVPSFKNLDTQIKNLCAMKLTVVRRGFAVVHMPNSVIYSKDIWDENVNEKIERQWLQKGVLKPKYSRLTTFRGMLKFSKLPAKHEKRYQEIKDKKRNMILNNDFAGSAEEEKFEEIYTKFKNHEIRNGTMLDGIALGFGLSTIKIRQKLKKRLIQDGLPPTISDYFLQDKAAKKEVKVYKQTSQLTKLLNTLDKIDPQK
jgi:hypothetical protein